ncbi:hypothetical protein IQ13_3234 [Lacibacter cauensis]|uniref:Bacteriophage CI repressor-like protein n=1 Tax=Lacibacter cauensis TaxID=510947 RepID=A0A562SIG0_9BACT|nr:hypothetical protein [Lacibacter cauensis]TWI80556.1 hypothetical protein IQ13_3234 [Lacibacter cauensis]
MNSTRDRILQFIDFKKISNRKFAEKISVSHVYFSKTGAMGSDVLEKISSNYPELNMDWIISGRGEMIVKPESRHLLNDTEEKYPIANWKDKYYDLMERYTSLLEQLNKLKNTG